MLNTEPCLAFVQFITDYWYKPEEEETERKFSEWWSGGGEALGGERENEYDRNTKTKIFLRSSIIPTLTAAALSEQFSLPEILSPGCNIFLKTCPPPQSRLILILHLSKHVCLLRWNQITLKHPRSALLLGECWKPLAEWTGKIKLN